MKNWLYFFLDKDGNSFYEDETGIVRTTQERVPLEHAPDGWQDIAIGVERDLKKHGLLLSFTFPFKFLRDGMKIARKMLYTYGIEFQLFLMITGRKIEFTTTDYADYQTMFYKGQVDFTTAVDEDNQITLKLGDAGLAKLIAANENKKYEFDLADPEASTVYYDGLLLEDTANFLITNSNDIRAQDMHLIGNGMSSREGDAAGFAGHQVFQTTILPGVWVSSLDYIFDTDIAINGMVIEGKVSFKRYVAPGTVIINPTYVRVFMVSNLGNQYELLANTVATENFFDYNFKQTFNAAAGEKFFLVGQCLGGSRACFYNESSYTVKFKSRSRGSYVRMFHPYVLLDKLVEKMAGARGFVVSTLLTATAWQNLYITSGDGLRSIIGAKVKISFKEFCDIYQIQCFAGYEVLNEKLYFEQAPTFYQQDATPIELGEVSELKIKPAKELFCNSVKIGNKEKSIDKVNGKYSFNNTFTFHMQDAIAEPKELPYVSPAVTDPYSIEHTRINFEGKTTTDSSNDNEFFVVHVTDGDEFSFTSTGYFTLASTKIMNVVSTDLTVLSRLVGGQKFTLSGTNNNNKTFTIVKALATTTGFDIYVLEDVVDDGIFNGNITFLLARTKKLYRAAYSSITGVPADDSIFNIELLTPKRLMMLHQTWWNSIFWPNVGKSLTFGTTEKNAELSTTLGGVTITEKDPLQITNDLLFKPFIFEFKTLVPVDFKKEINQSPRRPLRFYSDGYYFKGFILKAGAAPEDNAPQVYQALCTADTDIDPLINR